MNNDLFQQARAVYAAKDYACRMEATRSRRARWGCSTTR